MHIKWLRGVLLEMAEVFLEHAKKSFFRERFGEYIVHSYVLLVEVRKVKRVVLVLTMLEIHCNVVAANIRGHGNNWRVVKLAYEMRGGDAVQIWHDDIHEDQVVL